MSYSEDVSYSLISAVREGSLETVRNLVSKFGLSYSPAWSNGYILLRDAIENKHLEVTKLLLTNGAKVNSKNLKSTTPLHFAVYYGDSDVVEMLLDRGANVNARSRWGRTPLQEAIKYNKTEVIELLLNRGADVNHGNNSVALFHYAVEEGHLKTIDYLLQRGVFVDSACTAKRTKGYTALFLAAERGSDEIVKLLLRRGANINAKGQSGVTPLHIAAKSGHVDIVERLLKDGALVDSAYTSTSREGYTPLCLAVEKGSLEVVMLLLNRGADVNAKTKYGKIPLHIAVEGGHLQIIELLLQRGADINFALTSTTRIGYTPLCIALERSNIEIARLLLYRGAHVNPRGGGVTPLQIAAERGHLEIVEILLKNGAPVDSIENCSISRKGYTPLCLAVQKGHKKVVELLLKNRANVDAQGNDGKTILHFAVKNGSSAIIKHILSYRPDVNNKGNRKALNAAVQGCGKESNKIVKKLLQYGLTIVPEDVNNYKLLHPAVKKGYLEIVNQLLKYGTDINKQCGNSFTMPLHTATKYKRTEIAKLLISYRADVNAKDEAEKAPLFYAIENNDLNTTKLLLASGANLDNPDLLLSPVKMNRLEMVEILLRYGADPNVADEYGRTPLHFTVASDDEIFVFVFNKYSKSNVDDKIANLLLRWGANVNAQSKCGITTLCIAVQKGYVKIVETLLKHNADVNLALKSDISPLHFSAARGHEVICKMLLNKGANVNARQKNLMTPLYLAAREGNNKVVEILLRCGAKVNCKGSFDITPLHIAVENDYPKTVKVLLKFGADIDSKDKCNRTALHLASISGYAEIIRILLEHGSDINNECDEKKTAHDYAVDDKITFYDHFYLQDDDDFDNDIYPFKEVITSLEYHIVKLKVANLYLSEKNLRLSIISGRIIWEFQNKCEEEIASMKNEKIADTNVSFYNILTKGLTALAMYAGNKNIVHILRSNDYKIKFPIYASMIESNFRKGRERANLLEEAHTFFDSLSSVFPVLPYDCTEKIFGYLSDEDLRIFIRAFRNGEQKEVLLEQCYRFFHFHLNKLHEFSYDCTEKILNYLTADDLKNLVEASKPTNVSIP